MALHLAVLGGLESIVSEITLYGGDVKGLDKV